MFGLVAHPPSFQVLVNDLAQFGVRASEMCLSLGHAATLVQGSDGILETEHGLGQGWFLLLPFIPAIPVGVGLAAGNVSRELSTGFVLSTDGVLFCCLFTGFLRVSRSCAAWATWP